MLKRRTSDSVPKTSKKHRTTAKRGAVPPSLTLEKDASNASEDEWNGFSDNTSEEEWNGFSDDEVQDSRAPPQPVVKHYLHEEPEPRERPGILGCDEPTLSHADQTTALDDIETSESERINPAERLPWSLQVNVDSRKLYPGINKEERLSNEYREVVLLYCGSSADKALDISLHPQFSDPVRGESKPMPYHEWSNTLMFQLRNLSLYIEAAGANFELKSEVENRVMAQKEVETDARKTGPANVARPWLTPKDVERTTQRLEREGYKIREEVVNPLFRRTM